MNGVITQGENLADNNAAKLLYQAYQNFVNKNGPEQTLPGLRYSPNQLFWISSAQVWCTVTRPEYDRLLYATNPHAPAKYRVIGTVQNSPNFSSDFACPLGSQMNPIHKCEMW